MEIKKDIPMPANAGGIKWPFSKMAIGDCVEFADPNMQGRAQAYCHVYGSKFQRRFVTRREGGILRIWRSE